MVVFLRYPTVVCCSLFYSVSSPALPLVMVLDVYMVVLPVRLSLLVVTSSARHLPYVIFRVLLCQKDVLLPESGEDRTPGLPRVRRM